MNQKFLVNGSAIHSVAFDSKEAAEKSWELTYPDGKFDFDWNPDNTYAKVYSLNGVYRFSRERVGSIVLIDVCSEPCSLL